MNSNYHFLIIAELVTSQVLLQHHELQSSFVLGVKWYAYFSLLVKGLIRNAMGFAKVEPRHDKCVNVLGDYVEIEWHLVEDIIYVNSVMTFI
jgi:hypothetical protein